MVYLLFDNPGDKGKVSFISQLIHGEVNEIYSPKSKRLIVGWLKGCKYALEVSHSMIPLYVGMIFKLSFVIGYVGLPLKGERLCVSIFF